MSKSRYNWEKRDIVSLGPKVRFDTNNPQMGVNGSDVYDLYGVTDENYQCVIGLDEGGRFSVYNDKDVEFIAFFNFDKSIFSLLFVTLLIN